MTQGSDPRVGPQLTAELEAKLLRRIVSDWETINWGLFGDVMRPPVFELSDAHSTLGTWRSADRTLAMSRSAVLTRPWIETLETLKHEAAHQYVDEVLGGEALPHGPLFRQTCAARGIDGRATTEVSDAPENRVISRVRKLLALAESSNQHEAELAASTAQRMMLKHNLGLQLEPAAVQDDCAFLSLGEPTGRVQAHHRLLAALLTSHYFVKAIWIPVYRPLEGKRGSVLELCGRRENLTMAEFVHAFMLRTTQRLWAEHKRRCKVRSDKDRRSFLAGAVAGFADKLGEKRKGAEQEGLVWVGDAHVDAYYRQRHPRVVSTGGVRAGSAHAYAQGCSAGREIVLSRPVNSRGTNEPLALRSGK